MTIAPNTLQAIVNDKGLMHQTFRTWTQDATRELLPLIGTGNPEGVIEALQRRQYMDDAGTAGAILYIKRDADIGGDKTMGWILV